MAHWWENYPWRMIQTNLRQTDMENIDSDTFVRQLQSFGANTVLINTGGIIASYPTKVEDHFQSEYLHGDSLKKIMDACHDAKIRVMARMDFSKIRRPIYEKHPDWAYRDKSGHIVDYNGDVHACICGNYQQKKAFEIIEEVCRSLPIDGLFINMGGFKVDDYSYNYHGICHCDNCKRLFRSRFGEELPDIETDSDPVLRKYKLFKQKILSEYSIRLEKLIHGINPEIAIDKTDFTRMETNTEYKRPLPFWQYSASSNTRTLRGTDGKMVSSNTSVDFIGFFYRHVAVNCEEQELRLWQDVANFGGVDYYIISRLDNHEDKSAYPAVKKVFHYAKEHEEDYKNISSVADVLLIRGDVWGTEPEQRGWIRALTESHILFDEVMAGKITRETDFYKYKAIILPETEQLPQWLAEKLDNWVYHGGCVVSSGKTGIYDEKYEEYDDFPMKCLGIEKITAMRDDMTSAMFHVDEKDLSAFPSYSSDRLIYFGDSFIFSDHGAGCSSYFRLIPPHHIGPPERCYYTQITNIPGVTVCRYGSGKGIHIPWQCGTCFYRDGYDNTFRFIRDMMVNLVGVVPAADSALSPMAEVACGISRDGRHMIVNIVNNSGHFGTSFLPPVPMANISLAVPCPCIPTAVEEMTEDGTRGSGVDFNWENGTLHLKIGQVNHFCGMKVVLPKKEE